MGVSGCGEKTQGEDGRKEGWLYFPGYDYGGMGLESWLSS